MENKNENAKRNSRKANRILYIALAAVVCLGAVVCGILLANSDRNVQTIAPQVDAAPDDTPTGGGEDPTLVLPEFMAPAVGLVTKDHNLELPVYSNTLEAWRVHEGIDISAATGDKVMAAADGVISTIENDPLMGVTVTIRHNGNAETIYQNLAAELAENITVGAEVRCGQTIGCVGESAVAELADEPHLHFEMRVGGEAVDPMDYISSDSAAASFGEDVSYEG